MDSCRYYTQFVYASVNSVSTVQFLNGFFVGNKWLALNVSNETYNSDQLEVNLQKFIYLSHYEVW